MCLNDFRQKQAHDDVSALSFTVEKLLRAALKNTQSAPAADFSRVEFARLGAELSLFSFLFFVLSLGGYFCRTGVRVITYFALDGVHLFCFE